MKIKSKAESVAVKNAAPRKDVTRNHRGENPFVLDMVCVTTPIIERHEKDAQKWMTRAVDNMIAALEAAGQKKTFAITVDQPGAAGQSASGIKIEYLVSVSPHPDLSKLKNFRVYEIAITPNVPGGSESRITVRVSREAEVAPFGYRMQLQANPTTLLTGQNTRPMQSLLRSLRHDLAFQFGWPYLVLVTICQSTKPDFVPSKLLDRCFVRGEAQIDNVQIALSADIPFEMKHIVLSLMDESFAPRCVDDKLDSYRIGKYLGVKSRSLERSKVGQSNGAEKTQSVMLTKGSGDHCLGSVSCYDKATLLGLSEERAKTEGLADCLRLEATLQARGVSKLVTAAKSIAIRQQNGKNDWAKRRSGERCRVVDLIEAIAAIDASYRTTVGGKCMKGLPAWLIKEFCEREFCLRELFGTTLGKLGELEACFAGLAKKDLRYGTVFKEWSDGVGGFEPLRKRLLTAKVPKGSVDRVMTTVRQLGFSGRVPPKYFTDRDSLWITHGMAAHERKNFGPRLRAGKSVAESVARRDKRMADGCAAVMKAIASAADQSKVPTVEVVGRLLSPRPVETRSTTATSKLGGAAKSYEKPSLGFSLPPNKGASKVEFSKQNLFHLPTSRMGKQGASPLR